MSGRAIFGMSFLNMLGGNIRAIAEFDENSSSENILVLYLKLYYEKEFLTRLSFNIHGFDDNECKSLANNIKDNPYIMREVDAYLSGDVVE